MTRNEMKAHLDNKAGAVRGCFITIAPGQEATYILKAQQARSFVAAGYIGPIPSLVQSEMTATGETAATACTRILTEEAQWGILAGLIETIRRKAKVDIGLAETDAQADAIFATAVTQLSSMIPPSV